MSTVETTEALDALPPEIAVYPGTDADDQHVYIRDTTEGCWVAYVRADCVGVEEIPLPAYVPSQTAADQPTTEPSEAERGAALSAAADLLMCRAADRYIQAQSDTRSLSEPYEDGYEQAIQDLRAEAALAPAPQPAADTVEVQWGVRDNVSVTPCGDGEQMARDYVTFVDSTATVVKCTTTITTTVTRTSWEEA